MRDSHRVHKHKHRHEEHSHRKKCRRKKEKLLREVENEPREEIVKKSEADPKESVVTKVVAAPKEQVVAKELPARRVSRERSYPRIKSDSSSPETKLPSPPRFKGKTRSSSSSRSRSYSRSRGRRSYSRSGSRSSSGRSRSGKSRRRYSSSSASRSSSRSRSSRGSSDYRRRGRSPRYRRRRSPKSQSDSRSPPPASRRTDRDQAQGSEDSRNGREQKFRVKREPSNDRDQGSNPGRMNENPNWGKGDDKGDTKPLENKAKPDFGLSGKLAAEVNTYKGVVIKYSEPAEARLPKRRWRLYPFKGDEQLPTLYIHRQSAYLIGRDRVVADIPIDHPSCSKQHAVLQYRVVAYTKDNGMKGNRVRPYIIDLESANGTFVNNQKIEPKKYVELLEKDVIKFAFSSREYVVLHEHSKDDAEDDNVTLPED